MKLRELHDDPEAREIIQRTVRRDKRWGSGDIRDYSLFLIDETRKVERQRSALLVEKSRDPGE